MTEPIEFALVPLDRLRPHEQFVEAELHRLIRRIRSKGEFDNPIWVSRGSYVILNGHHRVEALRRLGAVLAPAWVVDYHGAIVRLDRWSPGPPISKEEVERRAAEGRLFPPKTTRHHLLTEPPPRRTYLADLLPGGSAPRPYEPSAEPSARPRAGASRVR